MIRSKQRRKIEVRFHELAVKEALQTITKEEHAKLERYQQLRRNGHPDDGTLTMGDWNRQKIPYLHRKAIRRTETLAAETPLTSHEPHRQRLAHTRATEPPDCCQKMLHGGSGFGAHGCDDCFENHSTSWAV